MNDSTPPTHCPRCGAPLPADAPEGLCPRCLAALHLGPETDLTGEPKAPPLPPLPPEELAPHFPQLEILECLGRGGMGVVYKTRQKSLNRLAALKLLAPERANDAQFERRFTREAQALAAMNHPHIVTVYDFGRAGGFYFLLMEFVDGVNLRQAMNAKRFTPEQALAVVPPVCEALQYAHEHGIVHRDIKPENLLLDKDGRVKIADFGIAKMLGEDAPTGLGDSQPAGTPQYMAPEQKEHQATDHRADIYSLGVVLYEMLTGERPKDKIEPPSKRVQVDVRIDEIVLRALEKTPELRYQTAAEMRTQVETIGAAPERPVGGQSPVDWQTWSPWQSALVREICAHLTPAEKRELEKRGLLFGCWNAATFFGPFFCVMFIPRPLGWIYGVAVLLVGLSFYPLWRRMQRESLCLTAWARQRGLTPDQLKASELSPGNARGSLLIPALIFAVLYAAFVCFLAMSAAELPARPAVHFGAGGSPNGWMNRSSYLLWSGAFPLLMLGLFWLASQSAKHFPALVNIPRRDYWLAPERRAETAALLLRWLLWLACGETLFFGALHALVLEANRETPPQLPSAPLLALVIAALMALMIWMIALLMRLAEAEHGRGLTATSNIQWDQQRERSPVSGDLRGKSRVEAAPDLAACTPTPATAVERFFWALGYRHRWSQRLLVISLPGFLGFLGCIPGAARMTWFLAFFAFLAAAVAIENRLRRTDPAGTRPHTWWQKAVVAAVLAPAIAMVVKSFLFAPYVISGNSAAPEIPAGSRIMVWKLSHRFVPGDLIAYRNGRDAFVGRVIQGSAAEITVNRNGQPDFPLPRSRVIGKVISVYWRGAGRVAPGLDPGEDNAGIGMALAWKDGHLVIGSLVPNAPASLDGRLQPGDEIVSFGDSPDAMTSAAGQPLGECVKAMRGRPGTPITLRVIPAGKTVAEAYELTLTRQLIPVLEADRLGQLGSPRPMAAIEQPADAGASDADKAARLSAQGWQLWQAGQLAEAVEKFSEAVRLAPNDANSWNGLGWANFNSGKTGEAEKAFEKVIALEPSHAGALNGLGQIYLAQWEYEKAEPFLLKAAAQPGASAAWFGLARLYLLQGKFEDAGKWAQMLVDSGQGDAVATKMLEAAKEKRLSDGLKQTIEPLAPAKVQAPPGNSN